ncbi:diguanylate cyclase [Sorangium sp. So ce302]|uniref:diguanylate cyclase n=1 Tax=Sorangium sp. So ce302 TaxID=3133297 RepID=UPI003F63A642
MADDRSWLDVLHAVVRSYEHRLLTERTFATDFQRLISAPDSPFEAAVCQIVRKPPFEEVQVGTSGSGPASDVKTVRDMDSFATFARLSFWWKRTPSHDVNFSDEVTSAVIELVKAYWKGSFRDSKSRLVSFQYEAVNKLASESISSLLDEGEIVCVFFADLDQFKLVNDHHGEETGDRVILEFGAELDRSARADAVVLHRSGDEFSLLFPANSIEDGLLLARRVMSAVNAYEFRIEPARVGISMGIAPLRRGDTVPSYGELESQAERALKPRSGPNQGKQRGRARVWCETNVPTCPRREQHNESIAVALLKSNIASKRPFLSPWLNLISERAADSVADDRMDAAELDGPITELLQWIGPQFDASLLCAAQPSGAVGSLAPSFSQLDCLLAIAHGLYRGIYQRGIRPDSSTELLVVSTGTEWLLQIAPDRRPLFALPTPDELDEDRTLRLGGFASRSDEASDKARTRRALLVRIGHERIRLPEALFAETVVLDDRPNRGGGLPDFWEATVARLVAHVATNENDVIVYALGNATSGAQTIAKLRDAENWPTNAEQIAYKTGMSLKDIGIASKRIAGNFFHMDTEEQLVVHLVDHLMAPIHVRTSSQPTSRSHSRYLRRELETKGMELTTFDGCRVRTIAEAYPLVVEIARKAGTGANVRDQSGSLLSELIDFRVHLTQPTQDMIPAFYEAESASLDQYFRSEFCEQDGLFAKKLRETRQLEAVVAHVAKVLSDPLRQATTRRAILVIPHEIPPSGEDIAPLGLVSVRIVPRLVAGGVRLSYSFSWRTVEALVGFPYSIYGSVRFAEYVTNLVQQRVSHRPGRTIEIGEVSYLAHSLHMFMDQYGQNIARQIVDDASI